LQIVQSWLKGAFKEPFMIRNITCCLNKSGFL
jgi:hypothetical protein